MKKSHHHSRQSPIASADAWKTYHDDELRFAVDCPADPRVRDEPVPTPFGTLSARVFDFAPRGAPWALVVMVTPSYVAAGEHSRATLVLESAQAAALESLRGALEGTEEVALDGMPGRAIRFTATRQGMPCTGRMSLFLRDGGMYQVMAMYVDGAADRAARCERFVNSFRFVRKARA